MSDLILGIDVGTTNCKAGVFTKDGKRLSYGSAPTTPRKSQEGKVEYEPEKLFCEVIRLLKKVLAGNFPSSKVRSIAITGMAEAGVPINKQGEAIYFAISWKDERSVPQFEKIASQVGSAKIKELTGLPPSYIYTLNKLLWLKENEPACFAKIDKWLDIPAWITYKLTGKQAMDYSQASRSMAYNIWRREWSPKLLNAAGVDPRIFSEITSSGTALGEIKHDIYQQIGLSQDVIMAIGGHDHPCAALGTGSMQLQFPLNSVGTTDVFLVSGQNKEISRIDNLNCSTGCHLFPQKYYSLIALTSAGDIIDWFSKSFYQSSHSHEELIKEASKIPRGSEGLRFLPPKLQTREGGKFLGIKKTHTRGHFARAIVEGLVMEFKSKLSVFPLDFLKEVAQINMVGGGAKNPLWNQIKAEALGVNLSVPKNKEAAIFGAAILGSIGAGVYQSYDEAITVTQKVTDTIHPDGKGTSFYDQLYKDEYLPLFEEADC